MHEGPSSSAEGAGASPETGRGSRSSSAGSSKEMGTKSGDGRGSAEAPRWTRYLQLGLDGLHCGRRLDDVASELAWPLRRTIPSARSPCGVRLATASGYLDDCLVELGIDDAIDPRDGIPAREQLRIRPLPETDTDVPTNEHRHPVVDRRNGTPATATRPGHGRPEPGDAADEVAATPAAAAWRARASSSVTASRWASSSGSTTMMQSPNRATAPSPGWTPARQSPTSTTTAPR